MRVLICGSRTFTDEAIIAHTLRGIVTKYSTAPTGAPDITLIHGAAKGADMLAAEVASTYEGLTILAFPADWNQYGKRAGYVRNQQMLDEGKPDMVLAFRSAGVSKGTDMMVDLARKAGIPTYVYTA